MWIYIKYAYEDITILQLNSAVREVHQIIPESCESVHKIFDKLVALRRASIDMGENLPENYWITEATCLVDPYYPREISEALQHPQCALLKMRIHFATFVKEQTQFQSTMFPKPSNPALSSNLPPVYPYATAPQSTMYTPPKTIVQQTSLPILRTPFIRATTIEQCAPTVTIGYQGQSPFQGPQAQASIVYPTPNQLSTSHLSPFKIRVYNSQAYRRFPRPIVQQSIGYTSSQLPQFANQIPPILHPTEVPIIEQPRYPPRGSYFQSPPNMNRRVCYSCGLSGHRAEFCPNYNLPVCYGCKGIRHKRPDCPLSWLPDDRVTQIQQLLVPLATVKPLLPLLQPTAPGKLYALTIDMTKPTITPTLSLIQVLHITLYPILPY